MLSTLIGPAHLSEKVARAAAAYQNKIARHLFEIACLKGLEELPATHRLPVQLLRHTHKAMALYDESIQFILGQLRRCGRTVQCMPQCAHCCFHMPGGISILELLYLYHGVHESGILPRLFRRCLSAEELWTEVLHRFTPKEPAPGAALPPEAAVFKSYQRMEQPCPFLQEDLCLVYPFRPIACRMHFSFSPPHWCHPAHFQHTHAVRFNLEPSESVFDAFERLNDRFQLELSNVMICGILELTVNVMQFEAIQWV